MRKAGFVETPRQRRDVPQQFAPPLRIQGARIVVRGDSTDDFRREQETAFHRAAFFFLPNRDRIRRIETARAQLPDGVPFMQRFVVRAGPAK